MGAAELAHISRTAAAGKKGEKKKGAAIRWLQLSLRLDFNIPPLKHSRVCPPGRSQTLHRGAAAPPGSLEKVGEERAPTGQRKEKRNRSELFDLQENAHLIVPVSWLDS